jgi:hypothetical protein
MVGSDSAKPAVQAPSQQAEVSLDKSGTPKALQLMRTKKPLVQCITNFVSMDIMANSLLAAGASPAMVCSFSFPLLELGLDDFSVSLLALQCPSNSAVISLCLLNTIHNIMPV